MTVPAMSGQPPRQTNPASMMMAGKGWTAQPRAWRGHLVSNLWVRMMMVMMLVAVMMVIMNHAMTMEHNVPT